MNPYIATVDPMYIPQIAHNLQIAPPEEESQEESDSQSRDDSSVTS